MYFQGMSAHRKQRFDKRRRFFKNTIFLNIGSMTSIGNNNSKHVLFKKTVDQ
jgi:hypothetical protein